jgi:hypothetical protein
MLLLPFFYICAAWGETLEGRIMNDNKKTGLRHICSTFFAFFLVLSISIAGALAALFHAASPSLALNPQPPGQWVSIGPDHVFGPALPGNNPPLGAVKDSRLCMKNVLGWIRLEGLFSLPG